MSSSANSFPRAGREDTRKLLTRHSGHMDVLSPEFVDAEKTLDFEDEVAVLAGGLYDTIFALPDPSALPFRRVFQINKARTLYTELTFLSIEALDALITASEFWVLPDSISRVLRAERAARDGISDVDIMAPVLKAACDGAVKGVIQLIESGSKA